MFLMFLIFLVTAAFTSALFVLIATTMVWLVCLASHPLGWIAILSNVGLTLFIVGFIINLFFVWRSGLFKDLDRHHAESDEFNY